MTSLLERVLDGQPGALVSSPLRSATETAQLALPAQHMAVDPLVGEYDCGGYEGPTAQQIPQLAPGWDIWRDGCPDGESTADVGRRADVFFRAHADHGTQPVVVTHGHFSRILAARALGLAPECGRLFASTTATVSLIEDRDGEVCLGLWNVDTALLGDAVEQADPSGPPADAMLPVVGSRT